MDNKKLFAILSIIVILAGIGVAYASYTMTSNSVSGAPGAKATLTLTANNSTGLVVSDTLQLTAHASDYKAGISIVLTNSGSDPVTGSPQVTDVNGNAVFYVVVNSAYNFVATGTHP